MAEIVGTPEDDRGPTRLNGTAEDDFIRGRAGDDEIFGRDGSDTLSGGGGDDTLVPGPSGAGPERVDPGRGSDRIDLAGLSAFLELGYFDAAPLNVTLNEGTGTARVVEQDGAVDTFTQFGRVARELGAFFGGGEGADRYDIAAVSAGAYLHVDPQGGDDTITLRGGEGTVRLGFATDGPDGVTVDLVTGRIDAGSQGDDRILYLGDPRRLQIQSGDSDDRFIGGNGRLEEWVWRGGDDSIDGAGRAITILNLTEDGVSGVTVDLAQGRATARWEGRSHTLTLSDVDQVLGGSAADLLRGDGGANLIEGGDGDDTIEGGEGNDLLRGDAGDDRILAGGGTANVLRGGDGDDTLISGTGADDIGGGAGDDLIDLTGMTSGFGGFISPGLGTDTIEGSRALWAQGDGHGLSYDDVGRPGAGLTVEIGAEGSGTAVSADGTIFDRFSFFDFFSTGAGDDLLMGLDDPSGSGRFEGFRGGAGDDTILGGTGGFDVIDYRGERFENGAVRAISVDLARGTARDTYGDRDVIEGIEAIWATGLDDVLRGSPSQDFLSFRGYRGADTLDGAELRGLADGTRLGFEIADYSDDARDGGTAGAVVDLAVGTGRDGFGTVDILRNVDGAIGTELQDVLRGSGTANDLRGRGGDDRLEGRGGNDTLRGDAGADTLVGGAGRDRLEGGDGGDVYVVDTGDIVVELAGGTGRDEIRTSVSFAIAPGVEQITALGRGNLRLEGSAAGETLLGNGGANILVGFGGADVMTGGGGADVFVLTARGGTPPEVSVTDWGRGGDRLAVDDQLLGLGAPGIDIRGLTVGTFREIRETGAVGYDARTGALRLDIDGDGTRELVATLEGGARLSLDDVLLF
ncbi:calcium-binding protein [Jannaschia seohaensis]|uniref:Uncharacterized protein n=1 Tax=Jannaschia seohaensis TaxID=475081 RepID=A0A2Y9A3Q5_9RHOB|nr:hypothetical protein [Jannaschia seohaensis]PWJ21820.1 hypothetical protein BCF38_101228 [Jannaschia seohaensis]SSA38098.1 hypothetical protein SAMN05421539_101228 [Jannaschia seohaensis]